MFLSGRSAARLAHLHGVQGVGGSNPLAPTKGDRVVGRLFIGDSQGASPVSEGTLIVKQYPRKDVLVL
jgi:hypothetical protein